MLKKANKITALLVAAAAVVSVAPATAVSATTKLGTKDGYIDNAIAFNGKYIYDGYKNDADGNEEDRAVYYNNGEKDSEVDEYDDEDYDFTTKTYGDKYAIAKDGDDEYLVDLSSGKVTDDTVEDKKDDTAQALQKAIKKTDKFDGAEVDAKDLNDVPSYTAFADPYYFVEKEGKTILTDADGKYVTADKTANVYYYSSERGKVVKVEDFNNDEDEGKDKYDSDSKLGARLDGYKFIAQDKDYVYAIANVQIQDASAKAVKGTLAHDATAATVAIKASDIVADLTTDAAATITVNGTVVNNNADKTAVQTAVDNAIKANYGTTNNIAGKTFVYKNGTLTATTEGATTLEAADFTAYAPAKYIKVTDGEAAVDKNEAADAAATYEAPKTYDVHYLMKISKAQGEKDDKAYLPKSVSSYLMDTKALYDNGDVNDATNWLLGNDGDYDKNADLVNVQVDGNSLYVYRLKDSDDKVKVLKIDLKNIKENPINKKEFGDDKLDGYVVKKDGDSDQDADAYDVDTNGVTWILHDGNIIKFNKKDKDTVYKVDSGMNKLDVYDENNLVAYTDDEDNKIYTTVSEGKKQTADDGAVVNPVTVDTTGTKWDKQADGTWKYLENGTAVTGWKFVGNAWYYMDPATTLMVTGWKQVNGTWYYLNADGSMATGWQSLGGNWYYLEPVNSNGSMKTGWFQDTTGTWYYADENGHMLSNTTVGGFKLGPSGAWIK